MKKVKRIINSKMLRLEDEILLAANSPLSKKVMEIQLPKKFVTPRFRFYNGTSDPINHVRHNKQTMALYEHDDALNVPYLPLQS